MNRQLAILTFLTLLAVSCGLFSKKPEAVPINPGLPDSLWNNIPKPTGYVNDFDHLLSADQEHYLDSVIHRFDSVTTNQIAIVTFPASWTPMEQFEKYVLGIHNKWGVGVKDINNGIVIGVCNAYRRIRISSGDGIVKVMPDSTTKKIIDQYITPEFKKEHYFEGLNAGVQEIIRFLETAQKPS